MGIRTPEQKKRRAEYSSRYYYEVAREKQLAASAERKRLRAEAAKCLDGKACTGCKKFKPRSAFCACPRNISGLASQCRACRAIAAHLKAETYRPRVNLSTKRWRDKNPEKVRESRLAAVFRRAQRTIEPVSLGRVLRRWGFTCHVCGEAIEPHIKNIHFDHLIPLKAGGAHTEDNIRPSHPACNVRKSGYLLQDFFARWVSESLGGPRVWI